MFTNNNPANEIFKAYVDFVTAVTKTSTEVYAKTWQDATKFNEVVAKTSQDLLKEYPGYKSVSNLWETYVPSKNSK